MPILQSRVLAAVSADPQLAKARTSRCSDYGACSLTRDLSGASGELLEMYHREKKADVKVFAAKSLPVFQATDLAGEARSSAELDGRAILVTLAGHCSHSVDAVPILNALHNALAPQGIRVVGVVVNSGSAEDVRAWYPQMNPRYEVWVHPGTEIGDALGSHLVPSYLLVSDRHIKQQLIGFKDRTTLDTALRAQLDARL